MDIAEPDLQFTDWYERAWPRLVNALTVSFAGDRDLAGDAAAEACARALLNWRRITLRGSPTGWAFTVGLNYGKRHRRRQRTEARFAKAGDGPPSDVRIESWSDELDDAMAALSSQQRKAILLRYVLDLSQAETAQALGVASGTAAATLHQARARLRDQLTTRRETTPTDSPDHAPAKPRRGVEDVRPR